MVGERESQSQEVIATFDSSELNGIRTRLATATAPSGSIATASERLESALAAEEDPEKRERLVMGASVVKSIIDFGIAIEQASAVTAVRAGLSEDDIALRVLHVSSEGVGASYISEVPFRSFGAQPQVPQAGPETPIS